MAEKKKRGPGRPRLEIKRVQVGFMLDREHVAWVADLARELECDRSAALRYSLDKWCRTRWPKHPDTERG